MYDLYLTLRSVTPGQKGAEALRRAGIPSVLIRAPRAIAPGGCAYALALKARSAAAAEAALARAGVRIEGRYLARPEGGWERAER